MGRSRAQIGSQVLQGQTPGNTNCFEATGDAWEESRIQMPPLFGQEFLFQAIAAMTSSDVLNQRS